MMTMIGNLMTAVAARCREIYNIFKIKSISLIRQILILIENTSPLRLLFIYVFLITTILVLLLILYDRFYGKKNVHSFKELVSMLPVKICYWQEWGKEYFVHGDIPLLLKTPLNGYGLIQFILTYNQEIIEDFNKLQNNSITHMHNVITNLNVTLYITKHKDYFFMVLNKLDANNESLITSSINNINSILWIEVDNVIVFANEKAQKYINTISGIKENPNKSIIYFDNNLYKYTSKSHPSYTINILTEINEFKNFNEQERQNEVLYGFLEFLKEKFFIMSRDSKIIFISEGFKSLINLKNSVYNVGDLFEIMRNNFFLPDEANFTNYINNLKNSIYFCKETQSEYFSCLDGRVFSKTMIPNGNYIMMTFEDVSQQIANKKEFVQNKNLSDVYWNNMEEGVIVFDSSGNLLFHNPSLKEFVNENHISTKKIFEEKLKLKSEEEGIYASTSIYDDKNFTIVKANESNLDIFILKHHAEEVQSNTLTDYLYRILTEIDLQFRYISYITTGETNTKKLQQLNFIYKSINRVKVLTNSNIDYYESPQLLTAKTIDLVNYIKSYLESMSHIYNMDNIKTSYLIKEYMVTVDVNLLQRCMMYLLEFFHSFFLTKNKTITIQSDKNSILIDMAIEEKFDINNFNSTRLLFVLQKLLRLMKFEVTLFETPKSFRLSIRYTE